MPLPGKPRTEPSRLLLLCITCLLLGASLLQAASPSLGSIIPRGGQRGTELELNFNGDRLADVKEILFYSPGFSLVEFKVTNPKHVLARIKIAADCRLGVHAMRLRTATELVGLRPSNIHRGCLDPLPVERGLHGFCHSNNLRIFLFIKLFSFSSCLTSSYNRHDPSYLFRTHDSNFC